MDIFSLLDRETVFPALHANDKAEILDKLISSLQNNVSNEEVEKIREAIMQREGIMSTGVGKGLAIPHGKTAGIQQTYAAFAILDEPVPYNSIDGEPVNMVFLLVGPQSSNSLHIKLLSRISRLMNNGEFRNQLKGCSSAEKIIDEFKEQEQLSFSS